MSHSLFPSPADACPNDNQLALYLQRQLPADVYAEMEQHVEQCPLCTELLVHLAHVIAPGEPQEIISPEGQWLGHYQVQGPLGKGGMGNVFAAYDSQLQRRVAVKLVRQDVSQASKRRQLNKRLIREARALAALNHPHVLAVYEIGEWQDQVFVAMQLVDGVDLRRWLVQEAPSWLEITRIFIQVAKGLMAAHAAGIVHRDIKPDNILITRERHPYLADFGLVANHIPPDQRNDPDPQALARLTQTGMLVGTPGYIAPEIYSGKAASPQADQFSFCVSLFEALFQHKPHILDPYPSHIRAIALGEFLELPSPALPPGLEDCLRQGMAPQPDQRYADMAALVDALERCIQQQESAQTKPERPTFTPETAATGSAITTAVQTLHPPTGSGTAGRQLGLLIGGVAMGLLIAWALVLWSRPSRPDAPQAWSTRSPQTSPKHRQLPTSTAPQQPRQMPLPRPARATKPRQPRLPRQKAVTPPRAVTRRRPRQQGQPRSSPKRPAVVSPKGSHCTRIAARYHSRNKRGWDAFSSPEGRKLWQEYALCQYRQGRCHKAFALDKQYVSLLAKRPQNEDFYAFRRAYQRCQLKPFVQHLAAPLQRTLQRITPYYASGQAFCNEIVQGILRRHHRQVRRLGWAAKEQWEKLIKAGLRCLALPLQKHRIAASQRRKTCHRLKRAFGLFQSSLPSNETIGVSFRKMYRSCTPKGP